MVVEACKKFIPSMAQGFDDERVELMIGDGFAFIDEHVNEFDVIITDSSDPEGLWIKYVCGFCSQMRMSSFGICAALACQSNLISVFD